MNENTKGRKILRLLSGVVAAALLHVWMAIPMLTVGVAALGVSACATMKSGPRAQLYEAASAYESVQIAIEAIVTSPAVGSELKQTLKSVDGQAMDALRAGRAALEEGREDDVVFYTQLLRQALIQARAYIAASSEAANAGVSRPEDLTAPR